MKQNIEAAKKLSARYKEIASGHSLKFESYDSGGDVMARITGFGNESTCCLCAAALDIFEECTHKEVSIHSSLKCAYCIYSLGLLLETHMCPCASELYIASYEAIDNANNSEELKEGLMFRAQVIDDLIAKIEDEENENLNQ